jgi:hypothetical protein
LQGIQAAKGVFKKKPEHDLTGATELLKIKDLDKQAVVPYSDAQSRLTHTRVPEKPKVVTSAGKKSSKVRHRASVPSALWLPFAYSADTANRKGAQLSATCYSRNVMHAFERLC